MLKNTLFILILFVLFASVNQSNAEVIINEVMADPYQNDTYCEWVEIYNNGISPVNISGWKFEASYIPNGTIIEPGEYIVIARKLVQVGDCFESVWGDSSGVWGDNPSLENYRVIELSMALNNSSADSVKLSDNAGYTQVYRWTTAPASKSMEKKYPSTDNSSTNWGTATGDLRKNNTSTPGKQNSLTDPIAVIGKVGFDKMSYSDTTDSAIIILIDHNLNTNPSAQDIATVTITSQSDPTGITLSLREVKNDVGVFRSDVFGTNLGFTKGTSDNVNKKIKVANNDTVYVKYNDGNPVGTIISTAIWSGLPGAMGIVSLDKSSYSGTLNRAIITVVDRDLNTLSSRQDTVVVYITSKSDSAGITLTLKEISANDSIFTSTAYGKDLGFSTIASDKTNKKIKVATGDTIKVVYNDANPFGSRISKAVWRVTTANVVINEVLANPNTPSETGYEWVEIYNNENTPIDLGGWSFIEGTNTTKFPDSTVISANGYLIIASDKVKFEQHWGDSSGVWGDTPFEQSFPVIKATMSLSNSSDQVTITNNDGYVQIYIWNTDTGNGISWEKKNPLGGDISSNWGKCIDSKGSTPGRRNSITPSPNDVGVFANDIKLVPSSPQQGDTVSISVFIKNKGTNSTSGNINVTIFDDANSNTVYDVGTEWGDTRTITQSISALDSVLVSVIWRGIPLGTHRISVKVDYASDENLSNNFAYKTIIVRSSQLTVVVNEVMANAPGSDYYNEFVELYIVADSLDLFHWQISDGSTSKDKIVLWDGTLKDTDAITNRTKVYKGEYVVILDPDYDNPANDQPYDFPPGTVVVMIDNTTIGSGGLSATEPVILYDSTSVEISTYGSPSDTSDNIPFSPNDGYSAERISVYLKDVETNWAQSLVYKGTPGGRNTVTLYPNDVGISASDIKFLPSYPQEGDTVSISVLVWNKGANPTSGNIPVKIFDDINGNSTLDSGELIGEYNITQIISSGNSVNITVKWQNVPIGTHTICVKIDYTDDYSANNFAYKVMTVRTSQPTVVVNEVMANAPGSDYYNEFIELYIVGVDSIDLANWKISDGTTSKDNIVEWSRLTLNDPDVIIGTTLVYKGEYVVILDPDYDNSANNQPYDFPPGTVVVTIDNTTFGSAGLSSTEPVILYDTLSVPISTYGSPDDSTDKIPFSPKDGYSVERIDFMKKDIESNWKESLFANGTPGRRNSVTLYNNDISISAKDIRFNPESPSANSNVTITAMIRNKGTKATSGDITIDIFNDINENSVWTTDEWGAQQTISAVLNAGDSISVSAVWNNVPKGKHNVSVKISYISDEDLTSNFAKTTLYVGYGASIIAINEVLANAPILEPDYEWVELYNNDTTSFDISGWMLNGFTIPQETSISGKGFLVIVRNKNAFESYWGNNSKAWGDTTTENYPIIENKTLSLSNSSAKIILTDGVGYTRSFTITKDAGDGVSYEKINSLLGDSSSNWKPCIAPKKSTPGRVNSVSIAENDLSIIAGNISFSPLIPQENSNITITAIVKNVGTKASAQNQITFSYLNTVDGSKSLIDSAQLSPISAGDSSVVLITWNNVPKGKYIIYANIGLDDKDFNNSATVRLVVGKFEREIVINEIMHSPVRDQTEWIELYNRVDYDINISNWELGDDEETQPITTSSIIIHPREFLIVVDDLKKFRKLYPDSSCAVIEQSKWETLANTSDDVIVLKDRFGFIVDRVLYGSKWIGKRDNGYSLERISFDNESNIEANWWGSAKLYGTPCDTNSISVASSDNAKIISIEPNPFAPGSSDYTRPHSTDINYIVPAKSLVTILIYDVRGRLVKTLVNNSPMVSGKINWDGKDDNGEVLRMGIYIVYLKAIGEKVSSDKKTVVIAKPLE